MIPLETQGTYHIYNRANGNEKIFSNRGNYDFFLSRYVDHIHPIAETFCYCLMPNHFHFLLRIRKEEEIQENLKETFSKLKFNKKPEIEKIMSKRFSNFFSSYTQAFNKQQSRMGSLFMKNFKRKRVTEQKYLLNLVHYIHSNPVEAGIVAKPEIWKYSSYKILIDENAKSFLNREEVIDWFGDKENFIQYDSNSLK